MTSPGNILIVAISLVSLAVPGNTLPWFSIQPEDTYVYLTTGHNEHLIRVLNCHVSNLQAGQVVSWKKDGIILSYNTLMSSVNNIDTLRYSVLNTTLQQFSLQITDITESSAVFDSGQYQCVVTFNNIEVIGSDLVHLYIYVEKTYNPTCQTSIPSDKEVQEGDTRIFTCKSKFILSPQVVLQWFRNDINSDPLTTSTPSIVDSMLITPYTWTAVKADEDVTFYCIATYESWQSRYTCHVGPFVILSKPNVVVMPAQLTLTSQNYATFTCEASSEPEPYSYVWKYDDVIVETGGQFTFNADKNVLNITDVSIHDNGHHTITCSVQHSNGTADLYVAFPTTIDTATTNTLTYTSHTTTSVSRSLEIVSKGLLTTDTITKHGRTIRTSSVTPVISPSNKAFSPTPQSILGADTILVSSAVGGAVGIIILILLVVIVVVLVMKSRQKYSSIQEPQQRLENDYRETEMCRRDEINTDAGQVNRGNDIERDYDDVRDEINVHFEINLRRTDTTPKYTYRGSGFESYNKGVQNEDYTTSGCRDDVSYEVVKKQPKMPASIENVREYQNMDTEKDDNQEAGQEHVYAQVNKKKKIPPTLPSTCRVDGNKVQYLDDINQIKENIKPTIKPKPSRPTTRCVDTDRNTDIETTECDVTHLTAEKVTDDSHGYDIVNIPVNGLSRDQQHAANVNSTADDNSVLYADVHPSPSDLDQTVNNKDNDSRHSNVEGLTYADLDFNDTMEVKGTLNRESEETLYAEVKL